MPLQVITVAVFILPSTQTDHISENVIAVGECDPLYFCLFRHSFWGCDKNVWMVVQIIPLPLVSRILYSILCIIVNVFYHCIKRIHFSNHFSTDIILPFCSGDKRFIQCFDLCSQFISGGISGGEWRLFILIYLYFRSYHTHQSTNLYWIKIFAFPKIKFT